MVYETIVARADIPLLSTTLYERYETHMTATTDTSTTLPESVTRLLTQAATHDLHCIEAHRDETALRIALHLEAPREGADPAERLGDAITAVLRGTTLEIRQHGRSLTSAELERVLEALPAAHLGEDLLICMLDAIIDGWHTLLDRDHHLREVDAKWGARRRVRLTASIGESMSRDAHAVSITRFDDQLIDAEGESRPLPSREDLVFVDQKPSNLKAASALLRGR